MRGACGYAGGGGLRKGAIEKNAQIVIALLQSEI